MEKYEKIRVVGRGAYGTVYLSKRISDGKLVIIKQIPVEQMTKDERQAALNESKVLSMLQHPNIIEYYENFLEDKALMIVMEYAQGGTLFEYLQNRNGRLLEEEEILKFLVQMVLSLQHVHSKQILHRDMKTQNILLDKRKEVVKIGDFGISKILSSKSKAYTVVGTPCYISPELCEGSPYNQKSDIWALGCVLYELTTLKRTFEAATLPALVLKIIQAKFEPISEHYSEEFTSLLMSMLQRDPDKRPNIQQIMAKPIIINSLLNLYTDMGAVPCTRVYRPMSSLPGHNRARKRHTISSRGSVSSGGTSDHVQIIDKYSSQNAVYIWGNGIHQPAKLMLPSVETQVVQVATGRTQKAAVTKNGRLFIWEASSIGLDTTLPGSIDSTMPAFVPRFLEGQSAVTIQQVACGDLFTACLTDRGILMTYGSGANGCLGHGNCHDVQQAKIVEALLGYEIMQVSCGASHVMAVTNDHEVFSWGRGENGRLGLGGKASYTCPQSVSIPDQYSICSVMCGVDCSIVKTVDGKLLCCGSNRYNKLGLDENAGIDNAVLKIDEVYEFTLQKITPLFDMRIECASVGTTHAAFVNDEGDCYTIGSNQYDQLGHAVGSFRPGKVVGLEGAKIERIDCGDTFTVAVSEDHRIFSWGKNSRGRLGRPDETGPKPKAIQFEENENFSVISLSCCHGNTLLATVGAPNRPQSKQSMKNR